jgi:hypothetical protein
MQRGTWTGTFNVYGPPAYSCGQSYTQSLRDSLSAEELTDYLNNLHDSIINRLGKDALDNGRLDVAYPGDGKGLQVVFYPSRGERVFVCPA